MMNLTPMIRFFQSYDPQPESCPVIRQIIACWDPAAVLLPGIRASSNFAVPCQINGQKAVLRFVPAEERSAVMVQAEMDTLKYLSERGLPVNRPIPARNGRLVETVETEIGVCHAAALTWLEGTVHDDLSDLPASLIPEWGAALGRLHNALQGTATANRPDWRDLLNRARSSLRAGDALLPIAAELETRLAQLSVSPQNYGLIHYDFQPDNLAWGADDKPGMFDFDDCAGHWFAADIAYALRDTWDDRSSQVELNNPIVQAFITGYRGVRPLSDADLANLPLFMRLHNLLTCARLEQIAAEKLPQLAPDWAVNLQSKLAGMAARSRQELASIR